MKLGPDTRENSRLEASDGYEGPRFEYLARNLNKVPVMALEQDFNAHGAEGWRFVAVAHDHAIFVRAVE